MPRPSTEAKSLDTLAPSSAKFMIHDKFASRWKTFEAGFKGLSEISRYVNALEVDLDKAKRLESELQTKTAENSALQMGQQQMLEGFTKRYKDWEGKEARLVGDLQVATKDVRDLKNQFAALRVGSVSNELFRRKVQEVQDEASGKARVVVDEKAAEVQRQKKLIDGLEKKLKKSEVELSDKSTLLLGSEEQLRRYRTDLDQRKAETELEELSADFAPALEHLLMKFHKLAKECFFTELPRELNCDDVFTELQRSRFMSVVSRAIPISNSEASKHIRMAAAESVIANEVTEKLLQPHHILDPNVTDVLENMLDALFEKNPRQGSILRSLLLAASVAEGTILETDVLKAVIEGARSILNPLLFDKVHSNTFAVGFNTLLLETLDLWSRAQKSPKRGEHVSLNAGELALVSSSKPLMTLFPRVYSPRNPVPWHSGYSLWSYQGVVVAGDLEAKEQAARVKSRKGERNSVAGKGGISVSSPSTNMSFQQRMKRNSISTRDPSAEKGESVVESADERQLERTSSRPSGSV